MMACDAWNFSKGCKVAAVGSSPLISVQAGRVGAGAANVGNKAVLFVK